MICFTFHVDTRLYWNENQTQFRDATIIIMNTFFMCKNGLFGTRIALCSLEWKGHDQTLNLDLLVLGITTNAKEWVTAKFRLLPAQYSAHYHPDAIMVIPNSFLSKIVNTNWLLFEWLWI